MTTAYYRPIARTDIARPKDALCLVGGWAWFNEVEVLSRGAGPEIVRARDLSRKEIGPLTETRAPLLGLGMDHPRLMGIVNATPDSFSDGGQHLGGAAVIHGMQLLKEGADILDIGGESTRPGADFVPEEEEARRVLPAIEALAAKALISVDTRKAGVAKAALDVGARMINDVSALGFDPAMPSVLAETRAPVCLMHAGGDPKTMQDDPRYEDVVLDVYDALQDRIADAESAGIARDRIVIDPGIGFGKTEAHNLALLHHLSLFHGLGCPILLGVSRKRFIGRIGQEDVPDQRMPGSVAVALHGIRQGVQITRVHDISATRQALALQLALF